MLELSLPGANVSVHAVGRKQPLSSREDLKLISVHAEIQTKCACVYVG